MYRIPCWGRRARALCTDRKREQTLSVIAELDRAVVELCRRSWSVIWKRTGRRGARRRERPGDSPAGLMAFCGATLESGFAAVSEAVQLAERIARADLVLTGEGRLDTQSAYGKTVRPEWQRSAKTGDTFPVLPLPA